MPKKTAKPAASRGRPQIPGRRVIVKLEERDIERARKLGGGGPHDVARGIRAALRRQSSG